MVPGLGVEPRRARGPRDFKATGERQRTKGLANSLPFPVSEESEEGRRVRGLWTPRWTPVSKPLTHALEFDYPGARQARFGNGRRLRGARDLHLRIDCSSPC